MEIFKCKINHHIIHNFNKFKINKELSAANLKEIYAKLEIVYQMIMIV